ncbi:hypothetical protein C900_01659 [Fulvivirga imtechensis AK7]|uniref:Uncharacterized protein n=1 Tax=Fulvivirga imtechensis AK7 TaxID=1237149 RepID=L8JYU1_9BACT|nr:hypothetical protein C900_01659 [Fulvivirga imtechensis AK7]
MYSRKRSLIITRLSAWIFVLLFIAFTYGYLFHKIFGYLG